VKASDSSSLTMPKHTLAIKLKRAHHQNSDLDAVPEKVAYLRKQVWIDSSNSIGFSDGVGGFR